MAVCHHHFKMLLFLSINFLPLLIGRTLGSPFGQGCTNVALLPITYAFQRHELLPRFEAFVESAPGYLEFYWHICNIEIPQIFL